MRYSKESEVVANALHKSWACDHKEWYTVGEIFYTICRYSPWAKKMFVAENYGVLKSTIDEMLQSTNTLNKMIEDNGTYRLDIYI